MEHYTASIVKNNKEIKSAGTWNNLTDAKRFVTTHWSLKSLTKNAYIEIEDTSAPIPSLILFVDENKNVVTLTERRDIGRYLDERVTFN